MSRPGASSSLAATDWNAERHPSRRLRLLSETDDSSATRGSKRRMRTLQSVWNALGYNLFWWVGVSSAARGDVWTGVVAMSVFVGVALWWAPAWERAAELRFLFLAAFVGWGLDSLMHQLGVLLYPSSRAAWTLGTSPPWIAALWIGFATMPRYSLAWLKPRPWWWSAALGATGGPLAFYAGTKLGAIAPGYDFATYAILAVEYALLTLFFVRWHARRFDATSSVN